MWVMQVIGDCPACGGVNAYGNVSVQKNHVTRGCCRCAYRMYVQLPALRKKILYLDQFFFSHSFLQKDQRFCEVSDEIRRATADQLLVVPYSSVHEDESEQFTGYAGKTKEDLVAFVKAMARGHEFEPAYEVEISQLVRAFKNFRSETSPDFKINSDDALSRDIHDWEDYFRFDAGRYWGDVEKLRSAKQRSVTMLVDDAFENWRHSTVTFEEQVEVEFQTVSKGYTHDYFKFASRLMQGDQEALFDSPLTTKYFQSLLHMLPLEEDPLERLKAIGRFFASEHFRQTPYLWVTARIYAVLKEMVKNGAYQNREEAKKRLSGVFQDIKHVATYAPYCDAFFMDKAMAHIVADPRINLEGRYGVQVFSLNNWDNFRQWLRNLRAGLSQKHLQALVHAYPTKTDTDDAHSTAPAKP